MSDGHAPVDGGGSRPSFEPDATAGPLHAFPHTDLGNAERLIARYGRLLRYCPAFQTWVVWNETIWRMDDSGIVIRLMGETMRATHHCAVELPDGDIRTSLIAWSRKSESARSHDAALKLARSREGVHVAPAEFDSDPWLLNVLNGTIDLRTGTLRPHRREDLCTKLAPVAFDPAAQCPRFEQFLNEVFVGREELVAFLRRGAGYSLTGSAGEEVVFLLYGTGRNGKTKLLELLRFVFGDYAKATPFATFLKRLNDSSARDDIARLIGARLVTASESASGKSLDTAMLKEMTGGDTVSARKLFCPYFDFRPSFKLWLGTNFKPRVSDSSVGMWARVRLIPFDAVFEGDAADKDLLEKLRAEASGILNWLVQGCIEWQRAGLGTPDVVKVETERYRREEDHVSAFIAERCLVGLDGAVAPTALSGAYREWCNDAGEEALKPADFNAAMRALRFAQKRTAGARLWHGISLRRDAAGGSADPSPPRPTPSCERCGGPAPDGLGVCDLCAAGDADPHVSADPLDGEQL